MRILAGTQTAYAMQAAANHHANGSVGQMSGKPGRFSLIKGQPAVIALKYPTGKRVPSRFGADQMMYTLADGRVGYFPLEVAAEIDSLRLAAGEPLEICHHGGAEWSVERVHVSARPANGVVVPQARAAAEARSSAATAGSAFRNSGPDGACQRAVAQPEFRGRARDRSHALHHRNGGSEMNGTDKLSVQQTGALGRAARLQLFTAALSGGYPTAVRGRAHERRSNECAY